MFQFRRFPLIRYGLAYEYMESVHVGFPIQKSPDQRIFAPPRSLSQLITLLPEAYRSLSRLSSALSARASTPRSLKLNQTSHPAGTGFDSRRIALRPLVHGLATAQDSRFSKQRRREVLALQCEALRKSIGRKSKPAKKSKIFELVLRCYYLIHTFVCFLFSDVLIKFLSKLISLISLQYAVFKVRSD